MRNQYQGLPVTAFDTLLGESQFKELDKNSPTPLYFQLYSLLKTLILDGTLPFSTRMPTEEVLATLFSVSRITAKRAMDDLAGEGLLERRRGKGTHVTYKYSPRPVKAPLVGMLQEIETMARNSRARVIRCSLQEPPQAIRDELGLKPGEQALHLIRVRQRDKLDFGYYVSWTAGVDVPADPAIFENTPRLSYFREKGLEVTHVTQTLSATEAGAEVSEALNVKPGSALLSLTRRSFNKHSDGEHMHDHLHVLYNPQHFQYEMDLEID
ncbi:MAG: GntR family transcriptional regulator [Rhodospirillaceae bacterium]|nr:GntR family transcriptional regulator [Rhodospirillaceae bacterium]